MRRADVVHVGVGPTHPDNRTAQAIAPTLVLWMVLAPSLGSEPPDGTDAQLAASEAAEYEAFVRNLPPCCMEKPERLVVSMASRKIHRQTCRYVSSPGSSAFPFAGADVVEALPHCGACLKS